jgi:hypothetical protein
MKIRIFYLLLFITGVMTRETVAQIAWAKYKTGVSVTYDEAIRFYEETAAKEKRSKLYTIGQSDNGRPLHLFVLSPDTIFDREELRKKGYTVLFINNGIHPGEPDGINACIKLVHDYFSDSLPLPEKVVLAIIPVYNIDGMLNTSTFFRSGQNGPREVGFRGNYRNLDLNRDFIKCDSENAKTFNKIYTEWDPDVFVDTHVTDGADYQYVMTLIDSQKDKLHPAITKVMQRTILPYLNIAMNNAGFPMSPYVNVWGEDPSKGMQGFLETPRFASGYSALYNAFPFVTETHMLKPFPLRVDCTYQFLQLIGIACQLYGTTLLEAREKARTIVANEQQEFPITWEHDSSKTDSLFFLGYQAEKKPSKVTGLEILGFETRNAYGQYIPYKNTYRSAITVKKPVAYLVPQAWKEVIERLKLNHIQMQPLQNDSLIRAEVYYIRDYKTSKTPYEGHYLHSQVQTEKDTQFIRCFKGDYLIYCNQPANRYIIETLEPQATDAFFAWGFFDAILQQKEWFSDYLFDETASKILEANPDMKTAFEKKKKEDPAFAQNAWAMYSWIFERSNWHEPTHNRYPVLRLF